jgi:hypothetical protein
MSKVISQQDGAPKARYEAAWLGIAWLAILAAFAITITGGISIARGPFVLRAHSVLPAAIAAVVCLVMTVRRGVGPAVGALTWWGHAIARRAAWTALAIAVAAFGIGVVWGSNVAGGSDSYCYLHQAELFASGHVRDEQPLAREAPWPNALRTLAPVSQVPVADGSAATAPACPPGYPLVLALARVIGGRAAMFLVVPLAGAMLIWCTFLAGRRISGPVAGLVAAMLLAASPIFLYQIVQPMTDIPAALLWMLAILASSSAGSTPSRAAVLSGLATGLALLTRPNLAPLAIVPLGLVLLRDGARSFKNALRTIVFFGAAAAPAFIVLVAINRAMHGGAIDSGYGRMDDLFALGRIPGNLSRYTRWLIGSETPAILAGFAAPFLLPRGSGARRLAIAFVAFFALTLACYLPYVQWDAWWFVRFLLPALPGLCALTAAAGVTAFSRWRAAASTPRHDVRARRDAVLFGAVSLLSVLLVVMAEERAAFRLRDLEARYREVGEYVARTLPPDAVVFADIESGSVRFYSGRLTVYVSTLDPAWLDRALEFMEARGRRPYLLLEAIEEPDFRAAFEPASRFGALDWPPMADFNRAVRIYDPRDYAIFRAGGRVATDFVFTRR